MPIRSFVCHNPNCSREEQEVDRLIGHEEDPIAYCESCLREMTSLYSTSFSAHYKGSGFHTTDYPTSA